MVQPYDRVQHRPRNANWADAMQQIQEEHPGSSRSEVRQILRARLLHMVDQFTADIFQADPEQKIKILAAFCRWDEETTKSALDPNWDRHSFFRSEALHPGHASLVQLLTRSIIPDGSKKERPPEGHPEHGQMLP